MSKQIISLNTIPNMIFFVVLIVGIGAVFGMLAYEVFEVNKKMVFVNKTQKDEIDILDKNKYFGNDFIQIKSPQKNTVIKSPVLISGEANVFEPNVRVKIKDGNKNVLANDFIMASGWMDAKYPFEKEIDYLSPTSLNGIIEIFEESTKDGNEIYKVVIPVVFEDYKDISDLQTYQNEEFGLEFKYPSNKFKLIENSNYKSSVNYLIRLKTNNSHEIKINKFRIEQNQTFENVIIKNSWLSGGGPQKPELSNFELRNIGNNNYYYRSFCGDIGTNERGNICKAYYFYWLVNDNNVYEFTLFDNLYVSQNFDLEDSISHLEFKQILSTFKFTE